MYRRVPSSKRKQCVIHIPLIHLAMIVGIGLHSENPSADRLKFVKVWIKFRRCFIFGHFIHDFFWVNEITINAHLGQTMEMWYAHRTFQIWFQPSILENERSAVADVSGRVTNSWEEHRYNETGVHASHFAILSAAVTVSFQLSIARIPLLWRCLGRRRLYHRT